MHQKKMLMVTNNKTEFFYDQRVYCCQLADPRYEQEINFIQQLSAFSYSPHAQTPFGERIGCYTPITLSLSLNEIVMQISKQYPIINN